MLQRERRKNKLYSRHFYWHLQSMLILASLSLLCYVFFRSKCLEDDWIVIKCAVTAEGKQIDSNGFIPIASLSSSHQAKAINIHIHNSLHELEFSRYTQSVSYWEAWLITLFDCTTARCFLATQVAWLEEQLASHHHCDTDWYFPTAIGQTAMKCS